MSELLNLEGNYYELNIKMFNRLQNTIKGWTGGKPNEDESNRPEKEQQQILEAKRARKKLSRLLQEPMRAQKFGKFLSTNSAALQNQLKQAAKK